MRCFIFLIAPALFVAGCGTIQKADKERNASFRYGRYMDAAIEISESNNRTEVQKAGIEASQQTSVSLPVKEEGNCEVDEEKFKELCENESAKEKSSKEVCAMLRKELDRNKEECESQSSVGTKVTFSPSPRTEASYNFAGATVGTVIIGSAGAYGHNGQRKRKPTIGLPGSVATQLADKTTGVLNPLLKWGAIFGIAGQLGGALSDGFSSAGDRYTDSYNPDLSDHSVTTTKITEGVME